MAYIHQIQVKLFTLFSIESESTHSIDFFQHMAIFTIYFGICLFGLLIRDYYHVSPSSITHELINKEENIMKSIIANRIEY